MTLKWFITEHIFKIVKRSALFKKPKFAMAKLKRDNELSDLNEKKIEVKKKKGKRLVIPNEKYNNKQSIQIKKNISVKIS